MVTNRSRVCRNADGGVTIVGWLLRKKGGVKGYTGIPDECVSKG